MDVKLSGHGQYINLIDFFLPQNFHYFVQFGSKKDIYTM